MLMGMTSVQITEWLAFAQVEPFGEWRADLRMATLAALIANVNRNDKARPEPYRPDDFMPNLDPVEVEPEERTADMLAQVKSITAMFGGTDKT